MILFTYRRTLTLSSYWIFVLITVLSIGAFGNGIQSQRTKENWPLKTLLGSKVILLPTLYKEVGAQKQWVEATSLLDGMPALIGMQWTQSQDFMLFGLAPVGTQTTYDSPYIKLYNLRPGEERLFLRDSQGLYVDPRQLVAMRHVNGKNALYSFPLRLPQQLETTSPVYRSDDTGGLYIQPLRTVPKEVMRAVLFTTVERDKDRSTILTIKNGSGEILSRATATQPLPLNCLDISVSWRDNHVVGVLGEPTDHPVAQRWRFKNLWFYEFEPATGVQPAKALLQPIQVTDPWVKVDMDDPQNVVPLVEDISYGFPACEAAQDHTIIFWRSHEFRTTGSNSETLIIRELFRWRGTNDSRLIDAWVQYTSVGQRTVWSLGSQGKLEITALLPLPSAYQELGLDFEPLVAINSEATQVAYINNSQMCVANIK